MTIIKLKMADLRTIRQSIDRNRLTEECGYIDPDGSYIPCDDESLSPIPASAYPESISSQKSVQRVLRDKNFRPSRVVSDKIVKTIHNKDVKSFQRLMETFNIDSDANLVLSVGFYSIISYTIFYMEYERDPQIIEYLLKIGANPNTRHKGTPVLFRVIGKPYGKVEKEIFEMLLKYDADPNIRNKEGNTMLHHLVTKREKGDLEKARILLKAGANPNIQNFKNESVLDVLLDKSPKKKGVKDSSVIDFTKLLLNHGANPNISYGALAILFMNNRYENQDKLDILDLLLNNKRYSVDPNVQYEEGDTPLTYAIGESKKDEKFAEELVKILLNAGADPNIRETESGSTPLFVAVQQNNAVKLTKLLLDAGADPKIKDYEGKTVLMEAISDTINDDEGAPKVPDEEVVKLLIGAGADPNIADNEGNTSLHYLTGNITSEDTTIAEILLANGANPSIQNSDGEIPYNFVPRKYKSAFKIMLEPHSFTKGAK